MVRSEDSTSLKHLQDFFARSAAQQALSHLKSRAAIAIHIEGEPRYLLKKIGSQIEVTCDNNSQADLSFFTSAIGVDVISQSSASSISDIGVVLLKQMTVEQDQGRLSATVHISIFELYRRGYFSVLASGGPQVLSFLAAKGIGSIAKIKSVITKIRG